MSASPKKKTPAKPAPKVSPTLLLVVAVVAIGAVGFLGYQVLQAKAPVASVAPVAPADAASAPITGPEVDGEAQVAGGVQKVAVNVGDTYSPNVIQLKAGVPAEITFSQGPGCRSTVQSQQLGFSADLSQGPATVKIAAPKSGTYAFACGMEMVHGRIVVR